MKKRLAAAAMGAALLAGGGAGAALMAPTLASAESNSSGTDSADAPKPGAWVSDALGTLVDDGTITQAQADAVQEALEAARPERGPGGPGGPGRRGPGLEAAATAIGIEAEELREALRSGQTIAEVAAANDVDVQKVIDALVADMSAHLDEAVANGRLTQARADEMKANAEERATALVNGERPERGGPPGPPLEDGATEDGAAEDSSTSA